MQETVEQPTSGTSLFAEPLEQQIHALPTGLTERWDYMSKVYSIRKRHVAVVYQK